MTNAIKDEQPWLRLRTPNDVLSAIPYLVGFYPADSLVVLGTDGPLGLVTLRFDLPPAADRAVAEELAGHLAGLLAHQEFGSAVLVGYGPERWVAPLIERVCAALAGRQIHVREALRADHGRWWSYLCSDPECCPPEGTPYDVGSSAIAAQATVAGKVALPDRTTLARTLAPLGGMVRESMRQATNRAERRFLDWIGEAGDILAVRERMVAEGVPFVREVIARACAGGDRLTDDEIAWLGVLLTHLRVRDEAWVRIGDEHLDTHVDLWRGVLRRVEETYAAGPACLLAFAAWRQGDGGLANLALDRAAAADPDYSMAQLLRDVVASGLPPSAARLMMTPEELAAAWDADRSRHSQDTGDGNGSPKPNQRGDPAISRRKAG